MTSATTDTVMISEVMIGAARTSIEIHNQMIAIAHSNAKLIRVMEIVCIQMNVTGDQAHSREIMFDLRHLVKDLQFMIDHRPETTIHLDAITV